MSAAVETKADVALGRGARRARALVTPDGVPLRVEIADYAERAAAFAGDFVVTLVATELILFFAALISFGHANATYAAGVFVAFLVRNAYFVCFELLWSGATPLKRAMGLRVVDRNGGALTAGAIVARNLSREAETFFPLGMIVTAQSWLAAPWEILPVALWLVLTAALPLCNRDRLRAGDLIAGTLVIAVPKQLLLEDLVERRHTYTFTDAQLDRYGILELHVLEDVLRRPATYETDRVLDEIAEKVRRKIGWSGSTPRDTRTFLLDFYTAQRAFLELRKNFGDERADKHHAATANDR